MLINIVCPLHSKSQNSGQAEIGTLKKGCPCNFRRLMQVVILAKGFLTERLHIEELKVHENGYK